MYNWRGERIKLPYIRKTQIKRETKREREKDRKKGRQSVREGEMGEYEGRREGRKVERKIVITVRGREQEKALTTKLQGLVCLWKEYIIVNKESFSTGGKLLVDSENHTVLIKH